MNKVWNSALHIDPARRDREAVIAAAVDLAMRGEPAPLEALPNPEVRRRAAYLTDLSQLMRGQQPEEAAALDRVRVSLPDRSPGPFWPGEMPSPPVADPVAEKWGYTRGVNVLRIRAALEAIKRGRRIAILPRALE